MSLYERRGVKQLVWEIPATLTDFTFRKLKKKVKVNPVSLVGKRQMVKCFSHLILGASRP